MKAIRAVLLLAFAVMVSGCTQQIVVPAETNFLLYENGLYGIRIIYPTSWEKLEYLEKNPYYTIVVGFRSPRGDIADTFLENMNIVVEEFSEPVTLDEYSNNAIDALAGIIPNMNLLESGNTTLAGRTAHKLVYLADKSELRQKFMQVWTIKGNKAYILTYVARPDKYNIYLGTIQKMIGSFEII